VLYFVSGFAARETASGEACSSKTTTTRIFRFDNDPKNEARELLFFSFSRKRFSEQRQGHNTDGPDTQPLARTLLLRRTHTCNTCSPAVSIA
jgi:hypothetical protein